MPALAAQRGWPLCARTRAVLRGRADDAVVHGAVFERMDLDDGWQAVAFVREAGAAGAALRPMRCEPAAWPAALAKLQGRWARAAGDRVLKRSRSGVVFQASLGGLPRDAASLDVVCKEGRVRGVVRRLGTRLRGPKEYREFWAGHALLQTGVRTPLPLACLWRREGLEIRARLITARLADARGLDQVLATLCARRGGIPVDPSGPPTLARLAGQLGVLIGRLARLGLYHRDLKASNIMVAGTPLQPWLIDLDGLQRDRRPFGPGFRRSLARLNLSARDAAALADTLPWRTLRSALPAGTPRTRRKQVWRAVRDRQRRLRRPRREGKLSDYA